MKYLFLADAPPMPGLTTGFGRVAMHLAKALTEAGHTVVQVAVNYTGGAHDYPWKLHPTTKEDPLGNDALSILTQSEMWDGIIALNDVWVLRRYHSIIHAVSRNAGTFEPPFYGYFPVDCEGWPSELVDALPYWAGVATYSEYGVNVLRQAGYQGSVTVIPHGVEPMADVEPLTLPAELGPSPWIVFRSDVNRRRKRYDLTISEFCEFAKNKPLPPHPTAPILWLHCAEEGDDLPIRDWYERCLKRTGYEYAQRPMIRSAHPNPSRHPYCQDAMLAAMYARADVYFTTTEAEGWGLCMVEAARYGALVVSAANSALTGLWEGCAVMIPPSGIRAETFGVAQFDRKGAIHQKRLSLEYPVYCPGDFASGLETAYQGGSAMEQLRKAAMVKWSQPEYHWGNIERRFVEWVSSPSPSHED